MKTKILVGFILISSLLSISNLNSQNIIQTSFYSQSLQKTNNVNIFLPSCYDSETSDYPVIYYLHGWGGSENSANLVMQLAETYINNGTIEPVIIVCANNQSSPLLGSFYVNSELNGDYEDYMTQELTTWIEDNYRVKSGKNYRSLMGQSMGGYGSFRLAILHKDLYRGIAAHGSAINFDLVIDDIKLEIKNENGPGPDYFYNFSTTGLFTKMIFAMAGAFSPNSASGQNYINPAVVEFPFDEYGNIIDSVYQKFSSNDPTNIIGTLLPSDSVAILFGAGRNDNLHLFPSNFAFKDTLEHYGLDYEYVDHYGTHNMPTLFRQRGLIFLDSIMSSSTLANLSPATLPFIEDWESQNGQQYTNGQLFSGDEYSWAFETNLQGEGRVRWGSDTHQPNTGGGAMTMDRNPSAAGTYAINYATLTLDLSNYTESSDLALSFWWADHGDEEQANDKVWIRGSENDSWVIIYDINPSTTTDDSYQFVAELDIDSTLTLASQSITNTFQLRFGQEDDYNTDWDGISFDDILIEDLSDCSSNIEPSNQSVCNLTGTSAELSWTENCSATTWEIRLDTMGFDTTNYIPVLITDNPYVWNNLSSNNYDWYIRAVCDNGEFSNWVGPETFTILKPFSLPFIEDWECENGEQYTTGQLFENDEYSWEFETNLEGEGRVRWGNTTHQPNTGSGALTMDRNPSKAGTYATNFVTLTLDLSNYSESSNLALSFWWTDHGDEEHANDKVWIRGSETDSWVLIFDLDPASATDNNYQPVTELDIDDALASSFQTVSSTFQLRFGQEDDYNSDWDGISIDNILIEDLPILDPVTLPFVENWEYQSGEKYINSNFYYSNTFKWSFETNYQTEGRVRWGNTTYQTNTGSGALTMDRNPSKAGTCAINFTTLTLDLSNYLESSNLALSFWWTDHGDENHANDKVWIRGSDTDSWVLIYDLDPMSASDDNYRLVSELDIDDVLASASQTVSSTFQLRFGQEDDYNTDWDGISIDDILIEDLPLLAPVTLPFIENWENQSGEKYVNSDFYVSSTFNWSFETDLQTEGRVRWGNTTHQPNTGSGALTMDRNPSKSGVYATNFAILTLDLSNYSGSSDLVLSFWWTDHGDEEHSNDKVWIRGSKNDSWVIIYDLNPLTADDDTYQLVAELDIDDVLSSSSQTVSSTFQLRFGQEDDNNSVWDGISYDDIIIEELPSESKSTEYSDSDISDTQRTKNNISIYSFHNNVYVKSLNEALLEQKDVFIFDIYGRMNDKITIPAQSLVKIPVEDCGCYKIIKVISNNNTLTHKVYID